MEVGLLVLVQALGVLGWGEIRTPSTQPVPLCAQDRTSNCLQLVPQPMSWSRANEHCRSLDGFLPHIDELQDVWKGGNSALIQPPPPTFTWTALTILDGHYQWLTLSPGVDTVVEWDKPSPPPASPTTSSCPALNATTSLFHLEDCGTELSFFCRLHNVSTTADVNPGDLKLRVEPRCDLGCEADLGWLHVNKSQFNSLALTCEVSQVNNGHILPENQTLVFWRKDGVYVGLHSPTVLPYIVHDPSKTWLSDTTTHTDTRLLQGTFWCESWIPGSSSRLVSNKVLVTVDDWLVVVAAVDMEVPPASSISTSNVNRRLKQSLRPHLTQIDNYIVDTLKEAEPVIGAWPKRSLVRYRSQIHVPAQLLDKVIQLGVNNSARFKELCSSMGCQSGSSLSLATYCLPHTQTIGDGRRAMWPASWAGLTQPNNMRCVVGNRLEYGMCHWNYTHGASIDALNISKCDRYDYCPRGYTGIPNGLCMLHTSKSDWHSSFSKIYESERVRSIMDVSFHAGSKEGQLPTYSYVRKMLRLAGHSILWLPVKRVRPFGRLIYQGPDLDLTIDQGLWNRSFVWKQGEPSIELDCLALNIGTNELFMEKCSANHSLVGIFDVPILPSSQFMALPTPDCPMEWLGSIGSDRPVCCKLFSSTKVHTSKQAQQFCEERGAGLPSPSVGFLDWFYRQFLLDYKVDSVWMTEDTPPWLPSAVDEHMDIVNWLPETNFSLQSVELTPTGWTRQDKDATKSNILCQMKPLHNVDIELTLSKEELQPPRMCLFTNRWALWKGTPKCYVNGEEVNITRNSRRECPYAIPVQRQGYYECRMWSRFPHKLISSNAILHRQPRTQTFIVTFQYISKYGSLSREIGETDNICATHLIENVKDKFPQSLISDISLRKTLYLQGREEIIDYLDILYSHDEEDEEEVYQAIISTRLPRECQLINVKSTKKCYKQVLPEFGIVRRNITWPETAGGSTTTSEELCISREGEPVARECRGDFLQGFEWSPPLDSCLGQPTNKTTSLWEISNDNTSQLADVPASLSSLTEDGSTLQPVDVLLVAKSFRSLSERKEQFSHKELEYVVDTLSNVMEAEDTIIESVQNKFMSSSILFKSFENMTFKVQFPEVEKDQMLRVPRPLLSVEYLSLKQDTNIIGYQTIEEKKVESLVLKGSTIETLHSDAAIILPENLTSNLVIPFESPDGIMYGSKIQLSFAVYKNSKLFQDTESFPNATVISPIIQATYKDRVIKHLEDPIKIIFKTPKRFRNRTFCVFWDHDKHDARGGWSTRGCWKGEGTDIHEVCYCDHLTCFAQLMNYDDFSEFDGYHGLALDIITIIGCCLSIFGLLLVFTTFLLFKKWRRPLDNKILVNLSFSVLCSLVIFLAGIKQTWNPVLCRSVAVSLHYFILASFGWMLVEAVHQYLKFVKVVGTYVPRFMWKASVCAWGLPLLPIVVVLVCDSSLYDNHNHGICWMSSQGFKYAFLPPLVVTMCVNIVVFSLILYGAVCGRARVTSTLSERELLLSQLRMAVCVFFLLGFTWIFGLLAVWKGRLIFSYLFCIFNTLQGFFIFVFHIYRGRSARSLWEDFLSIISKATPHSTDRSNSNNAHASLHYGSSGRRLDIDSVIYNQARGIMSFPRKPFAHRTGSKHLSKTSSTVCLHTKTNYTP